MLINVIRTKMRLKILYSMTFCLLEILHKMSNNFDANQNLTFFCRVKGGSPVMMYNVRNNRISDVCVYAQIRKGLGMHLVTYMNRDTVPFLLIVQ